LLGDAVISNSLRGNKMGPLKEFSHVMKAKLKPGRVLNICEFKTSQLCSRCHSKLSSCCSNSRPAQYRRFIKDFRKKKRQKRREHLQWLKDQSDPNLISDSDSDHESEEEVVRIKAPGTVIKAFPNRISSRLTSPSTATLTPKVKISQSPTLYCPQCQRVVNRDINAARNMLYCFLYACAFKGQRPAPFDRSPKEEAEIWAE
jgi:hypothetical protein